MASCKFNSGIECGEPSSCAKCGWNPQVAAVRVEKAKKKRSARPKMRIDPKAIGCSVCLGSGLLHSEDNAAVLSHVAKDKFCVQKEGWDFPMFHFPHCPKCGRPLTEED